MTDTDHDAIVYDLDGTLVRLDVDWDAAAREVTAILDDRGVDTADLSLWDMLERSVETDHRDVVGSAIAEYEIDGAENPQPLPLAGALPHDVPVGVVSLNCEEACRRALSVHGLDGYVDVVIGRDSVDRFKPDPQPLLAAVEALDSDPSRALFVGDSASDKRTADDAGVDFKWVGDGR